MKKTSFTTLLLAAMLLLGLYGCAMFRSRQAEIYPMSYDQTYETTLSALDDMEPWRVVETNHKQGIIVIESSGYLRPEKKIRVMVKRIEPFRTKVELYQKKATPFTGKFFKAIDRRVEERAVTYPS